jgi:hypothetical protein
MRSEVTQGIHHRIIEACLTPGFLQAVPIGFDIDELERVGGYKFQINQLVPRLEQAGDAASRIQTEMVPTLWTDLEVGFQIGFKDVLATTLALQPKSLGANALCCIGFNLVFLPLEPGHVFPFATRPPWFPLPLQSLEHSYSWCDFLPLILCSFSCLKKLRKYSFSGRQ